MPLESFYGGKQGVSPIIKARFQYVTNAQRKDGSYYDEAYGRAIKGKKTEDIDIINSQTMEWCFSQPNYTDVWFGELAIINTQNKRNPNNGKLFRRTLKGTDTDKDGVSHAEYLGTIVGPSEGFPFINIADGIDSPTGLKNIVSNIPISDADKGGVQFNYPTAKNTTATTYEFDNNTKLYTHEATIENRALVPGAKKENNVWKHEKGIKYSWVNVRNNIDGEEQDTYVYLGFEIPYTIFDFEFDDVPWNDTGNVADFINKNEYLGIKPDNDNSSWESTPFYQNWKIHLKKGKPGNQIGYLRRAKANTFRNFSKDSDKILYNYNSIFNTSISASNFDFVAPKITWENSIGKIKIGNKDVDISSEDYLGEEIQGDTDILVYTVYTIAKNTDEIKEFNCFLTKIKDINNIELETNGTVKISYNDATSQSLEQKIKWISGIQKYTTTTEGNNPISIEGYQIKYNTGDSYNFFPPYFYDTWIDVNRETNPTFNIKYRRVQNNITPTGQESVGLSTAMTLKNKQNPAQEKDFNFSFIDSLKVDNDTKELVYATAPVMHRMNENDQPFNDWDHNTTDKFWTKFGDGVYLNNVDKVVIYNGYLYVLYSSSEYRYTPSTFTTENLYADGVSRNIRVARDDSGRKWKCSDMSVFSPNKLTDSWENLWWLELGPVQKPREGVWISSEFDTERFTKYYKTKYPNDNTISKWEDFTFSNNAQAVRSLMNGVWPVTNEKSIDGGWTIDQRETNPYKDGHIYLYENAARDNNGDINLTLLPNDDQMGNLVKFKNNYFYYDYNSRKWQTAGVFGDTEANTTSNWPILLNTAENNIFPQDKEDKADSDHTLVLIERTFQVEDSYLEDIFS